MRACTHARLILCERTHTYTHAHIHTCTLTHTCVLAYTKAGTCIRLHICLHTCPHILSYSCMQARMEVCMRARTHPRMRPCTCIRTHICRNLKALGLCGSMAIADAKQWAVLSLPADSLEQMGPSSAGHCACLHILCNMLLCCCVRRCVCFLARCLATQGKVP